MNAISHRAEQRPAEEERATILVVDDTTASRYISGSWLRRRGHRVIEAGTGAEALAILAATEVDLVLLDVGLPDMSGFDVCQRIKNDPALAQPVIHLSATAIRGADRAQGLTRGADAYLTEPVEPDELLATVTSLLRYYRARAAAERLADQLTKLSTVTLAMNSATSITELTSAIAAGTASVLGAPAVALVGEPDGTLRRALVADPLDNVPTGDEAPAELLEELSALQLTSPGVTPFGMPWRLPAPHASEDPANSSAVVYRSRSGTPLVCIAVRLATLTAEETNLLAQLGRAAVLAVDSLRLHIEEHSLALILQRSFLPDRPPALPSLQIAVRYVPATSNAEIGGDFYELVELGDGRLLVAIGDVAGHSIHAATVMVELRHALRAFTVEGHGPVEILRRLERVLRHYHPTEFATLCLVLVDLENNMLRVANAGHLPPLLVRPTGAAYLAVHGPMLGLRREQPEETVLPLPSAWGIVLVTDGLIEDVTTDLDRGMEDLRTAVSFDVAPEQLCDQLIERFGQETRDDVALLVLRRP
ncbi:MAG TPA: fused response regulator/phosphatase [Pseudonocardiaceae bacterium]|nr:fused response regulator/phosphatase [Pseudonocardiaceae bacterium]